MTKGVVVVTTPIYQDIVRIVISHVLPHFKTVPCSDVRETSVISHFMGVVLITTQIYEHTLQYVV